MKALLPAALAVALCLTLEIPASASPPSADISTLGSSPAAEQKKDDATTAKMKAEFQHLRGLVNAAKKPEDLDPVLFDLQKYENGNFLSGITPDNQELYQQLVGGVQFAKEWQNYLSHMATGQTDMARSDLSSLSQNNYGAGLIPRSRILALLANPPAPNPGDATPVANNGLDYWKMIEAMNSLDDLEPTLDRLNALSANDATARGYAERLAPMVEIYGDLKSGLPTSVNINFMGGTEGAGATAKINALLMNFILAHYFDTYKGAPPADNETPAAYVTRVKNDAFAGQDWPLLKKALTAHAFLYRNIAAASGAPDNETAGFDDLVAGINQEEAGQYALAVASFQDALKAGSLDIPAKFIGTRLDEIKRDHPAEYDSGMATFLSPPMPQYNPGMNPGMNPAMYNAMMYQQRFRPGMPGYPGALPTQQPNPVLSIPGARTVPASAPPAAK